MNDAEPVPELRESEPRATACVRLVLPADRLKEAFDEHLPNVAHRVADLGGAVVGAPYGRFHRQDETEVDLEVGVPVDAPLANLRPVEEAAPGEVAAGELPGGRLAVTVHRGSYDTLPAAYEELRGWIVGQGLAPGRSPWESYIDDPAEVDDPTQLRTEICWPISESTEDGTATTAG